MNTPIDHWGLNLTTLDGKVVRWHITSSAKGSLEPICESSENTRAWSEEEANARLIASAPELLVALHNALGSLEACELILKPRTERARLSADIREVRAVIAKAKAGGAS